jgi:hypothetical protein
VLAIGRGRGANPETTLIAKHDAADRLLGIARAIEGVQ